MSSHTLPNIRRILSMASPSNTLRRYFPKEMELLEITDAQVQQALERLNHRPRKVLGYKTPHEVFFGVEMRYTNKP